MTQRGVLPIDEQEKHASIEGLPQSLRDLGEIHGLRLVLRLVQEFGGVGVKVPKVAAPHTDLVRLLGEADAQLVIDVCAGEKLEVPRSIMSHQSKVDLILSLAAKNLRHVDIARQAGCSDRWVREVLSTHTKKDKRQIDMFG